MAAATPESGRARGLSALLAKDAGEVGSPAELCAALGSGLGLDQPVPVSVMRRAIVDKAFAFHLVNAAGNARLLGVLFDDPRNRQYEDGADSSESALPPSTAAPPDPVLPSNATLAWRAGQAVARWGASGFGRVAPEVFEARFSTCQTCEYLVEPPDRVVYKVKLRRESDPRVCAACGCVASRKAALPTENCPVPDQADPSLSRWGEPMKPRTRSGPEATSSS